jgi:hypothetical protein
MIRLTQHIEGSKKSLPGSDLTGGLRVRDIIPFE